MKIRNNLILLESLIIMVLIVFSISDTALTINIENFQSNKDLNIDNYFLNNVIENNAGMFIQLPILPGDPMPVGWPSHSPWGWRSHEDFWDISSPICNIHWWGSTAIKDGSKEYPGTPDGMTFNIIFYENNDGKPGEVVCSYIDILPLFVATGIMYGPYELFYFETNLDPYCELSEGWVSIQSSYSLDDSGFIWIDSLDGNSCLFQYGYGHWFNDTTDLALMLTDENQNPDPDLDCEGSITIKKVLPGDVVNGSFTVKNVGDPDSILHWKIDLSPEWGTNWTFTPPANISLTEEGWKTVNVEVVVPEEENTKFTGSIKVINSVNPDDKCEIPILIKTTLQSNLIQSSKVIPSFNQNLINIDRIAPINENSKNKDFVSGEFIVKFKDNSAVSSPLIKNLNIQFQVSSIKKIFNKHDNDILDNIYIVDVPDDSDIISIIDEYLSCPEVEYAEPNYIAQSCIVPNDPGFNFQWALHNTGQTSGKPDSDIDAPEAWDIETGKNNIIIAISDTGVDWDHPDLASKIWINSDEILDGNDTDGNGYIDDVRGWDFVNEDNNPMDDNGHGTCCAGIASADTNNNIGMAGISWNCQIMALKGLNEDGVGTHYDLAGNIIYAADNGANIISMSWGGSASLLIKDSLEYAYSQGLVLIAAAGNGHTINKHYPAAYDNVIGVAATYYNDEKMYFSNFGSWVDIAAPGYDIYATALDDRYTSCFYGTSASTPHVAGISGLILSKNPSFNQEELRTIIRSTIDPVKSNQYIGIGRINAYRAIQRDSTPIASLNYSLDEATILNEINITGTASGNTFKNYSVFYGLGVYPNEWILIYESSAPVNDCVLAQWEPPIELSDDVCTIRLIVYDNLNQISEDRAIVNINFPPKKPNINGPLNGKVGKPYTYTFMSTELSGDDIFYYIDWGDGYIEEWIGPYASGEEVKSTHVWIEKSTFKIRAKAKDTDDQESDWTTKEIPIMKNRGNNFNFNYLSWFFNRFPNILPILRNILGLLYNYHSLF